MTTIVSDSFTRSNSSTSLGNADTGQSWVTQTPTAVFGITSNKAGWISGTGSWDVTSIESSAADAVVALDLDGVTDGALMFRLSDANNYWIYLGGGSLFKNVAGTFTQVGGTGPSGVGTYSAKLAGSAISILKNGVSGLAVTDAFNSTATKHGIACYHDPTMTFDNFLVTGAAAKPVISSFALRRSYYY